MKPWQWLSLAIACSVAANGFMKEASVSLRPTGWGIFSIQSALSIVLLALGLYCYISSLSRLQLSIAYPILVGSTTVGTILLAIVMFGERIDAGHALGAALILAGLGMIVWSSFS